MSKTFDPLPKGPQRTTTLIENIKSAENGDTILVGSERERQIAENAVLLERDDDPNIVIHFVVEPKASTIS